MPPSSLPSTAHNNLSPFSKHLEHAVPGTYQATDDTIPMLKNLLAKVETFREKIRLPESSDSMKASISKAKLATSLLCGLSGTFSILQSIELRGKGEGGELSQKYQNVKSSKEGSSSIIGIKAHSTPIEIFRQRVDAYVSKLERLSPSQNGNKDLQSKLTTVNTKAAKRIVKRTLQSTPCHKMEQR